MPSVPNDVLLLIISQLDIDTFLTARCLNRATHGLIAQHMRGLVESVAHSTFGDESRLLTTRPSPADSNASECLTWLKNLRYEYLAAVMLECRVVDAKRDSSEVAVSAQDAMGDKSRSHFVAGLRVLNEFCAIARAVNSTPQDQLGPCTGTVACHDDATQSATQDVCHARELHTCQRRLDYVRTLDIESLHAYRHLRHEEMVKLMFDFTFMPSTDVDCDSTARKQAHFVSAWLFSRIAHAGPAWLWHDWNPNESTSRASLHAAQQELQHEWDHASPALRECQAHAILCIDRLVNAKLHIHIRPSMQAHRELHRRNPPAEDIIPYRANETALALSRDVPAPACVLRARSLIIRLDWSMFGFDSSDVSSSARELMELRLRYENRILSTLFPTRKYPRQLLQPLSPAFEVIVQGIYDEVELPTDQRRRAHSRGSICAHAARFDRSRRNYVVPV